MRRILIPIFALASSSAHAGPSSVGNGGDAVRCAAENGGSRFVGLYSLDYLLTESSAGDGDLEAVGTWDDSRARLSRLLAAKQPDLAFSFGRFVDDLANHSDPSRPEMWSEAPFGLVSVDDQAAVHLLPPNCGDRADPLNLKVYQAVVQVVRPDLRIFNYDSAILDELRGDPLQYSFLLVHEWLRAWSDDVAVIRDVDRYLHSRDAALVSPEAFNLALENLGLSLAPRGEFQAICDRPRAVRAGVEAALRVGCAQIAPTTTNGVASLHVPILKIGPADSLAVSALVGLNIGNLDAQGAGLRHLYFGQFQVQEHLGIVNLADNNLTEIAPLQFAYNHELSIINLSGNRLTHFPADFLGSSVASAGVDRWIHLDLHGNQLQSFPDCSAVPGLEYRNLDLSNNQLQAVPETLCNCMVPNGNSGEPEVVDLRGNPLPEALKTGLRSACARRGVTLLAD